MTDPHDRRLIQIILKDFYNSEVLKDNFEITKSYKIPQGVLSEFVESIH